MMAVTVSRVSTVSTVSLSQEVLGGGIEILDTVETVETVRRYPYMWGLRG